jgi:hypothetical protein
VRLKKLKILRKKSKANAFYWFGFNGKETNNYQGYTAKVVENLGTILTPNASGIPASKIDDALSILKTTFTGLNIFSKGSTDAQGGLDALDAQSSDNQAALNKANSKSIENKANETNRQVMGEKKRKIIEEIPDGSYFYVTGSVPGGRKKEGKGARIIDESENRIHKKDTVGP